MLHALKQTRLSANQSARIILVILNVNKVIRTELT